MEFSKFLSPIDRKFNAYNCCDRSIALKVLMRTSLFHFSFSHKLQSNHGGRFFLYQPPFIKSRYNMYTNSLPSKPLFAHCSPIVSSSGHSSDRLFWQPFHLDRIYCGLVGIVVLSGGGHNNSTTQHTQLTNQLCPPRIQSINSGVSSKEPSSSNAKAAERDNAPTGLAGLRFQLNPQQQ